MSESNQESAVSIEQAVEAILMTTDKSVKPAQVADALSESLGGGFDSDAVRQAIEALNLTYSDSNRAFSIENVAGGYRIMARPELAEILASFHGHRASTRLSRAALETLSIVAYRQPVTRAEIESIRGVACGEVLRSLMDRRLVTIAGRAEELGRPMLYGTTRDFLSQFGLANLKDLPEMEEAPALKTQRKPEEVSPDIKPTTDEQVTQAQEPSVEGTQA